jgi:hypothetical protein
MGANLFPLALTAFLVLGSLFAMVVERKRFHSLVLAKERSPRFKSAMFLTIILFCGGGGVIGGALGFLFCCIAPPGLTVLSIAPAVQEGVKAAMALSFVGLASLFATGKAIESLGRRYRVQV